MKGHTANCFPRGGSASGVAVCIHFNLELRMFLYSVTIAKGHIFSTSSFGANTTLNNNSPSQETSVNFMPEFICFFYKFVLLNNSSYLRKSLRANLGRQLKSSKKKDLRKKELASGGNTAQRIRNHTDAEEKPTFSEVLSIYLFS